MTHFEIYQRLRDIEVMCKIALTHATPATRNEIVGHCSGRTVEDMFSGIKALSEECREALKPGLEG